MGQLGFVEPLGVFGILAEQREIEQLGEQLRVLSGGVAKPERPRIAHYLRSGRIVVALMEHSRDVLGGKFWVPGGSGICTDGAYYWRYDAANYVEEYGTELPPEFLEYGRHRLWQPPQLTEKQVLAVDRYLMRHLGGRTVPNDPGGIQN